ncbi:MAG: RAD55 family ATPase [Candidatus Njordarchaeales archaeon]
MGFTPPYMKIDKEKVEKLQKLLSNERDATYIRNYIGIPNFERLIKESFTAYYRELIEREVKKIYGEKEIARDVILALVMERILRGNTYLVAGPAGAGKSIFAMQFLLAGARLGEFSVYVTYEETYNNLLKDFKNFKNWDFEKYAIYFKEFMEKAKKITAKILEENDRLTNFSEKDLLKLFFKNEPRIRSNLKARNIDPSNIIKRFYDELKKSLGDKRVIIFSPEPIIGYEIEEYMHDKFRIYQAEDRAESIDLTTQQIINAFSSEESGPFISRFVIDSISALIDLKLKESRSSSVSLRDVREPFINIKSSLERRGITTVLTGEALEEGKTRWGVEDFLARGSIYLGFYEIGGTRERYIRILKMRGVDHDRRKFGIGIDTYWGFQIWEAILEI